jgi:hypothetical protein
MRKDGQTRPRYPFVWRNSLEECKKKNAEEKIKANSEPYTAIPPPPPPPHHIPLTDSQYNSENNRHPGMGRGDTRYRVLFKLLTIGANIISSRRYLSNV